MNRSAIGPPQHVINRLVNLTDCVFVNLVCLSHRLRALHVLVDVDYLLKLLQLCLQMLHVLITDFGCGLADEW